MTLAFKSVKKLAATGKDYRAPHPIGIRRTRKKIKETLLLEKGATEGRHYFHSGPVSIMTACYV